MSEDPAARLDEWLDLLEMLRAQGYRFVTPTPATHARVVARRSEARDVRDVLGWNLPFAAGSIDTEIVAALDACGALEERGALLAARVRVSTLDDLLLLHSAFPTTQQDAVFFGPDSYRFAAFLKAEFPRLGDRTNIADIGTGTGIGAIIAARHFTPATMTFSDTNPKALELAMPNAYHARAHAGAIFALGPGLEQLDQTFDLVIANPPYIADPLHRAYRDGGAMHGAALSLRWAEEAAQKLAHGGALLLYTGSAIVNGEDLFRAELERTLSDFDISYREIDPDVFGEELEREDYADVERIAVVGVVAVKR